jgi:hypothetical protein
MAAMDGIPALSAQQTALSAQQGEPLLLPARLLEEALSQDERRLRLDELCAAGLGSAEYGNTGPQFDVEHVAPELPPKLRGPVLSAEGVHVFARHGVLPEIQRMWRTYDTELVLWRYTNPRVPDVTSYCGVTQQLTSVALAKPKRFISGINYFLVLATPVEVSLHALRFAPGGCERLLPLVRTQYAVSTDDVVVSAVACDDCTGRIFLAEVMAVCMSFSILTMQIGIGLGSRVKHDEAP